MKGYGEFLDASPFVAHNTRLIFTCLYLPLEKLLQLLNFPLSNKQKTIEAHGSKKIQIQWKQFLILLFVSYAQN